MTDLLHPSASSEPKINVDLTPIVPIVQFNIHSNNYIIERLSIRPLEAVEAHFDFVIERKYLVAQKPDWQVVEWHPKLSHFEENLHPNLSHPNRLSCLIFEQGWARSDQRGNFKQIT